MRSDNIHLWKHVCERLPHFSQPARRFVFDAWLAADSPWHIERTSERSCVLSRLIDIDASDWPYDVEQVTITVDWIGRFKSCRREKVITVDTGRSYADARRMLRMK